MELQKRQVTRLRQHILSWYKKHKRDLPWRKTKDPYKILISEVMLQQTQVDRVVAYYERWLKALPTFEKLFRVSTKKLLTLWSGLGYNNRVLRLRALAGVVIKDHKAKLPKTYEQLIRLPGIGDYTANAILAFAFNKSVPVMDTNIRRVLIHELKLSEKISLDELKIISLQLIPKEKSCIWHNALMDYGALFKTARRTGIKPLSQQGAFVGSNREVRGFITKELTQKDSLPMNVVKKNFPDKDVVVIVNKMVEDGLVQVKDGFLVLA